MIDSPSAQQASVGRFVAAISSSESVSNNPRTKSWFSTSPKAPQKTGLLHPTFEHVTATVSTTSSLGRPQKLSEAPEPKTNKKSENSLASKLSRSFYDLASNERLRGWKAKLPSTAKKNPKEQTGRRKNPAPAEPEWRQMPLESAEGRLNSDIGAVDAFYNSQDQLGDKEDTSHLRVQPVRRPQNGPNYRHSTGGVLLRGKSPPLLDARSMERSSKPESADRAPNYDEVDLIWTKNPASHLLPTSSNENLNLPPPARITPFSGVPQAKDADLIRPIAFRPVMTSSTVVSPNQSTDQTLQSELETASSIQYLNRLSAPKASSDTTYSTSQKFLPNLEPSRQSYSPGQFSDSFFKPKPLSMAPRPSDLPMQRPRPVYESSQSRLSNVSTPADHPVPNGNSKGKDDDYDLVPEFIDLLKQHLGPNIDQPPKSSVSSPGKQQQRWAERSPQIRARHEHQSSYGSRQSSGIHVTPSPSDSGVAELEAVLREKESELSNLRTTMEANEEIIVRVYQEKEQKWQERIKECNTRLQLAAGNEQKMMAQIQRLKEEKGELHAMVQNLTAEKQGLQRKCREIEREMFEYKEKLEAVNNNYSLCRQCGTVFRPHSQTQENSLKRMSDSLSSSSSIPHQGRSSSRSDPKAQTPTDVLLLQVLETTGSPSSQEFLSKPVPPPRIQNSKSPTPQIELRQEISALREEVMNLKDSMHRQINSFSEQKNRWEDERDKVIQYQKLLQNNYVQVTKRNQELEQLMHS